MASEWAVMRALDAVDVLGPKPGESWSKTVEKIAAALDEARSRGEARVRERVVTATQEFCRCGGMGPDDPGVCDACRIYHMAGLGEEHGREAH